MMPPLLPFHPCPADNILASGEDSKRKGGGERESSERKDKGKLTYRYGGTTSQTSAHERLP